MSFAKIIYVCEVPAIPYPKLVASENITDFEKTGPVGVYELKAVEHLTISKRLSKQPDAVAPMYKLQEKT